MTLDRNLCTTNKLALETELRLFSFNIVTYPSDKLLETGVSRSLGFQITKIVAIFRKKNPLITDYMC